MFVLVAFSFFVEDFEPRTIDRKYIKIMHVVFETLPHLTMKFYLYFHY
jgi:hypothetical protein